MAAPTNLTSIQIRMNNGRAYTIQSPGETNTVNLIEVSELNNAFYDTAKEGALVLNKCAVTVTDTNNNVKTTQANIARNLQKYISVTVSENDNMRLYKNTKMSEIWGGFKIFMLPFVSIDRYGKLEPVYDANVIKDAVDTISICAKISYMSEGSTVSAFADFGRLKDFDIITVKSTAPKQKYSDGENKYGEKLPEMSEYYNLGKQLPDGTVDNVFKVNYESIDKPSEVTLKYYAYLGTLPSEKLFSLITVDGQAYQRTLTVPVAGFGLDYEIANADPLNPEKYDGNSVGWLSNYDQDTNDTSIKITVEDKV